MAIIAVVVLIFAGLAALPLFISADALRTELAARIEAASGRATRIDGPVSFSVIPTAHLSAEGIGIAGLAGDAEDFSVESVSFGLSLLPLIAGKIDIYGVTIVRPVILVKTDENGRTNWTGTGNGSPPAPTGIEDMIAANEGGAGSAPQDTLAVLDRLSIGRVTVEDGTLLWRDLSAGGEERLDNINLDIRVPRLDGPGTIQGNFKWLGILRSLEIRLGKRPDPGRFESVPINLKLSTEAGTVAAEGTAMAGDRLFDGSIETEGKSLVAFAASYGIDLPELPIFGAFNVSGRLDASTSQIRINQFDADIAGVKARGAAVIGLDRVRPGIGLKVVADSVETALFVPNQGADRNSTVGSSPATSATSDALDFSALSLVDANIDASAKEILIGAVPITDFGVDIQIVNGGFNASVRSATVNGAPASGTIAIDTSADKPRIKGDVKVDGLDAAGIAALAGVGLPVKSGVVAADVTFATRGITQSEMMENLDGSGRVTLADGHIGGLGIADLVGGDAAADEVANVDLTAEFSSLSAPIEAKGGFDWRGERFTVSGNGDPRALASGGTTPITIQASSKRVDFGFSGEAGLAGVGSGVVSLSTQSLRSLLAWIGQPLPPGGGLDAFSIKGPVTLGESEFSFEKAAFTLDGSSGIGTGKVTFSGKPTVIAGLAMKRLDVTPYLIASGASAGAATTTSSDAGRGWSSDPIGFEGLRAIDANLNLKADEMVADQIKIGPSRLTASISGGALTAELTEMSLYSGIGVGTLSIDGSSQTPSVQAFFRLDNIDALPFLRDAVGFSWIEGTASLSFDIRSAGGNQAALMAGLNGKGTMNFSNGAIRGIDIPKMVRSLSVDTLLGWQRSGSEKTDFSQLSGTYTIESGILTNRDLVLIGPALRVTGAGRVDIPNKTISYRVDPKIVASLEGQGGAQDLEGFAVPVRVEGAWDRPRIYPEIEGILQDPQKALDQLRKLGGGLFGGKVSKETQADAPAGKSVEDRINDELSKGLGKLFGGSNDGGTAKQEAQPGQPITAPTGQQQPSDQSSVGSPAEGEATTTQPANQPPAESPSANPLSPLDLLLGQPADAPDETPSAAPQESSPPDGAKTDETPTTKDQPIDLLKSILGQ